MMRICRKYGLKILENDSFYPNNNLHTNGKIHMIEIYMEIYINYGKYNGCIKKVSQKCYKIYCITTSVLLLLLRIDYQYSLYNKYYSFNLIRIL